ncbi:41 kD caentrosomal protein A [Acrasis kona]|uniref:41 kD caentrosomal protein A n=1 Tax=Acrasis kona TaxID=1008807 RepID=A0AAW2Z162_9EUKA
MSSIIKPIGDAKVMGVYDILDKKVTGSKKYDSVKATINSGPTLDKALKKVGEAGINARFRRDEHFKRIKKSELAKKMMINEEDNKTFMLLDVRDADDFTRCHLLGAVHYPAPMLSRSVNPLLPEMYSFKNKEGKLLIIYDYDEKIVIPLGNLFFEKGFDNVEVLTGGLKDFGVQFPELIQGTLPEDPTLKKTVKKKPSSSPPTSSRSSTISYDDAPSSPSSVASSPSSVILFVTHNNDDNN